MGERRILKEDVLTKQKSGRKLTALLCSDFLILLNDGQLYRMVSRCDSGSRANSLTPALKQPMPLEELVVREVPSGVRGRDDLAFQLVHAGSDKINLRCSSARACHAWMHAIDSARQECLTASVSRSDTVAKTFSSFLLLHISASRT